MLPQARLLSQAWRLAEDEVSLQRIFDAELVVESDADAVIRWVRRNKDRRIRWIRLEVDLQMILSDVQLGRVEVDDLEVGGTGSTG